MNILRWKIRKLAAVIGGIIVLYFLIKCRKYLITGNIKIPNAPPNDVWEYMADFSNMMHLNPTMIDFEILSESGNFQHWQYTASYREKLGHWPYLENINVGHFSIHSNWRKQLYFINSTHTTCFYKIYCLYSESEYKFTHFNFTETKQIGTVYEERIKFECPPIFAYFCVREAKNQRMAIMKNLAKHFDK